MQSLSYVHEGVFCHESCWCEPFSACKVRLCFPRVGSGRLWSTGTNLTLVFSPGSARVGIRAAWMQTRSVRFYECPGAWTGNWGLVFWPGGAARRRMFSQPGARAVACAFRHVLPVSGAATSTRIWGGLYPVFSQGRAFWELVGRLNRRISLCFCRVASLAFCFSRTRECTGKLIGGVAIANAGSGTIPDVNTNSECRAQVEGSPGRGLHGFLAAAFGGGGSAAFKVGAATSTKEYSWCGGSVRARCVGLFANDWRFRGAAITSEGFPGETFSL